MKEGQKISEKKVIGIGEVQLTGMCLATIVGIVLGLAMYIIDKAGWANDK